ncbi:MAG TPA: serine protease [Pseudomonadales bacterium]|nr:serine protease [Pseudomonadales bacterium]
MRKGAHPSLPLLFLFVLAIALTGCVSPKSVTTIGGDDLSRYRKVYFVAGGEDPRGVYPRVESRLRQAGFNVTVVNPKGPPMNMQGTGFVISSDGYALTCAHVVTGVHEATIWVEGVRYPCRVLNSDTNLDLALLKVDGDHPPFHSLRLESGKDYSLGENVYTMGFPLVDVLGTSPRLNNGLISAKVGLNDDTNFVQVSVPIQPGNSGGPLLNADGQVIGVVSSTLNPMGILLRTGNALPQNVNFAIKLASVRKFLEASQVAIPTNVIAGNFDQAESAVALVRSGNVTDAELKEPELYCACTYQSEHGFNWHFHVIGIGFVDGKTGKLIFRIAEGFGTVSEDKELDHMFSVISDKFFPGQPNPFGGG